MDYKPNMPEKNAGNIEGSQSGFADKLPFVSFFKVILNITALFHV
jgi:hypothetical protein